MGASLARLAPGGLKLPVGGKAMHPRVAIPVGHVHIAAGARHQLGGVVEGAGRPGAQGPRHFAARVRVDAPVANHLQRLAVQGVPQAHRVLAVGDVNDVVLDKNAVGIADGVQAPGADVLAVGIEDDDGRLLPLKGVQVALGVSGAGADHAELFAFRQLGPALHQFVSIFSASYGSHRTFTSKSSGGLSAPSIGIWR